MKTLILILTACLLLSCSEYDGSDCEEIDSGIEECPDCWEPIAHLCREGSVDNLTDYCSHPGDRACHNNALVVCREDAYGCYAWEGIPPEQGSTATYCTYIEDEETGEGDWGYVSRARDECETPLERTCLNEPTYSDLLICVSAINDTGQVYLTRQALLRCSDYGLVCAVSEYGRADCVPE